MYCELFRKATHKKNQIGFSSKIEMPLLGLAQVENSISNSLLLNTTPGIVSSQQKPPKKHTWICTWIVIEISLLTRCASHQSSSDNRIYAIMTGSLLMCTLISENQVLKNQGLLRTLEKFQVLQTWIFFSRSPPGKKSQNHTIKGRSQTTFTRRGRWVVQKCPLFVNVVCEQPLNQKKIQVCRT